jgi:DNA-directed RNA polymerase specialized sigma24 family protein
MRDLAQLTTMMRKRREMMQPSIELRRRYLASAYAAQLGTEKGIIEQHINRLQPGLRRVFMRRRLEQLNGVR